MLRPDYKLIRNTEKVYPHHIRLLEFKRPFSVPIGPRETKKGKNKRIHTDFAAHLLIVRSLRRTKTVIQDIILCNNFDYFCTFTFKDNRSNVDMCKSRMQYWLHSQQKTHGTFDYLIVPEFHEDGQSLHFHALFRGYKGTIVDSGYKSPTTGKTIYNVTSYRSGFSTVTNIDQDEDARAAVASYVTKYITKDMPLFHSKKRYWVSSSLARPIKTVNVDSMPYLNNDNVEKYDNEFYTIYIAEN